MKLLHVCLAFLLLTEVVPLTCPDTRSEDWGQTKLYGDALTVFYATVTSSSSDERGILCARLESELESWIGFGVSPSGRMLGGEAIIGLPDDGTVKKHGMIGSPRGVYPMDDGNQTLMDEQIMQEDGRTIMKFTKYLQEDGEHEILATGENVFLFALGKSNSLGKHWASGVFRIDFGMPSPIPESTIPSSDDPATPTNENQATTRKTPVAVVLGAGAFVASFAIGFLPIE